MVRDSTSRSYSLSYNKIISALSLQRQSPFQSAHRKIFNNLRRPYISSALPRYHLHAPDSHQDHTCCLHGQSHSLSPARTDLVSQSHLRLNDHQAYTTERYRCLRDKASADVSRQRSRLRYFKHSLDADHSDLQCLSYPPYPADVARVEVAS